MKRFFKIFFLTFFILLFLYFITNSIAECSSLTSVTDKIGLAVLKIHKNFITPPGSVESLKVIDGKFAVVNSFDGKFHLFSHSKLRTSVHLSDIDLMGKATSQFLNRQPYAYNGNLMEFEPLFMNKKKVALSVKAFFTLDVQDKILKVVTDTSLPTKDLVPGYTYVNGLYTDIVKFDLLSGVKQPTSFNK